MLHELSNDKSSANLDFFPFSGDCYEGLITVVTHRTYLESLRHIQA